ncbi:RNA-splicing factor [Rhizoclosmatium hyalinum]|nr:RNA-splicing factor [Rhizoclosmatium hyalinum]
MTGAAITMVRQMVMDRLNHADEDDGNDADLEDSEGEWTTEEEEGGGDLNLKKSWHPQTLKNIERVYLRERAADEEKKKIEQKRKEIEEQRAHLELQALHEASGKVKKRTERLEWIYAGPAAAEAMEEEREAYLLGKKRIDKLVEQGKTVDEMSAQSTFSANDALTYGANANSARDMQNKIREDPLLAIKRREQASLQAIINNPVRLKALKESKSSSSDKKKKSKKDKKEKKEKKSKKSSKHKSDDERDGSRDGDRKRERSPPSSSESDEEDDRASKRHRDERRSPERSSSSRRSPERLLRRDNDEKIQERSQSAHLDSRHNSTGSRERSPYPSDRRREDDRNPRDERSRDYHRRDDSRDYNNSSRNYRGETERRNDYYDNRSRRDDFGRDRRDDATRYDNNSRNEIRKSEATDEAPLEVKRNTLDDARQKRLEAMMQNAKESDVERQARIAESRRKEMEEAKRETELQMNKLKDVGRTKGDEIELGGISGLNTADMIRRNRHTVQRGDDSFLSR